MRRKPSRNRPVVGQSGADQRQPAKRSLPQHPFDGSRRSLVEPRKRHRQFHAGFPHRCQDVPHFPVRRRKNFFRENMLAGFRRLDHHIPVHIRRRIYDDCVNPAALQHLVERDEKRNAILGGFLLPTRRVFVPHRAQLCMGIFQHLTRIILRMHMPVTDFADSNHKAPPWFHSSLLAYTCFSFFGYTKLRGAACSIFPYQTCRRSPAFLFNEGRQKLEFVYNT